MVAVVPANPRPPQPEPVYRWEGRVCCRGAAIVAVVLHEGEDGGAAAGAVLPCPLCQGGLLLRDADNQTSEPVWLGRRAGKGGGRLPAAADAGMSLGGCRGARRTASTGNGATVPIFA
ncbi:MAG: hypothetical protein H6668_24410 [Ardenticatenaceae bacterium]|nr:hypothetical protein [Ardenticatenaceae bacterium]